MIRTVLLTGSNGFLGSHIADALLRNDYKVRAMVRPTSDLTWLEQKPVSYVYASLNDPESLKKAVEGVDAVIHNAAVVSSDNKYHYYKHNTEGTRNLAEAVLDKAPDIERFVFVSSQAAGGPTENQDPRKEDVLPQPVTDYGHSKLLAENHLRKFKDLLPISIIRPPALYGPRDTAWLTFFKLISRGIMPLVGRRRELTLTHGQDAARQVLLQLEKKEAIGDIFHSAPFEPTTFEEFGRCIAKVLGVTPKVFVVEDILIKTVYPIIYPAFGIFKIKPPFRKDKVVDALVKRWTINGEKAHDLLGFEGRLPLMAGVGQTVEWYRWKGWLQSPRDRLKARGGSVTKSRQVENHKVQYDPSCDLCALAIDGEVKTVKHYEDDDFIIVDCLICREPMAVLKNHRAHFTDEEKDRLDQIFVNVLDKKYYTDYEQRRIPEHAHVHCRSHRHALPWQKRPE